MRISDWSSDVCSSDLPIVADIALEITAIALAGGKAPLAGNGRVVGLGGRGAGIHADPHGVAPGKLIAHPAQIGRASCREECVRTCRSRWSPYHSKKKQRQKIYKHHHIK